MLSNIVARYWDLCMLRGSPAQLPAATAFAAVVVVVNILGSLVLFRLLDTNNETELFSTLHRVVLAATALAAVLALLLAVRGKLPRLSRTIAAAFGIDLVITVAQTALSLLALQLDLTPLLAASFLIGVGWWSAAVGQVLADALEMPVALAFIVAFFLLWLSFQLPALVTSAA